MNAIQEQIDILTRSLEILSDADLCDCPPTFQEMREILDGLEIHARWARMHVQGRLEQTEDEAQRRGIPIGGGAPGSDGHSVYLPHKGKA
jgi:hypothetical protein